MNCTQEKINEETSVNVVSTKGSGTKPKCLTHGQKLKLGKSELLEINTLLAELSTPNFFSTMEFFTEVR